MVDSTKVFIAYDVSIHVFDVIFLEFLSLFHLILPFIKGIGVVSNLQFIFCYIDTIPFDRLFIFYFLRLYIIF